jgi:ankyrin repeat protein
VLLANGAEVNATDSGTAKTPLHFAADQGYKDVVELLLAHGAEVNAKTSDGSTPMYLAAEHGYKDVAEVLLAHKAEYTFQELAAVDDLERVRAILRNHPDMVSGKGEVGWISLHSAAENGYKDMVELLLANKADVNARDSLGETPLEWAAYYGLTDMVRLLLAHGAAVNTMDGYDGSSPLHEAAKQGHTDVVKLLLAHHANVNAKENNGRTPMDGLNEYGDVAEVLRRHGGHE